MAIVNGAAISAFDGDRRRRGEAAISDRRWRVTFHGEGHRDLEIRRRGEAAISSSSFLLSRGGLIFYFFFPSFSRWRPRRWEATAEPASSSSSTLSHGGGEGCGRWRSKATADGLRMLSDAMIKHGGSEAASLRIAEQYIKAFGNIAKEGTTMLLPSPAGHPSAMVAQALAIYKNLVGSVAAPKNLSRALTRRHKRRHREGITSQLA